MLKRKVILIVLLWQLCNEKLAQVGFMYGTVYFFFFNWSYFFLLLADLPSGGNESLPGNFVFKNSVKHWKDQKTIHKTFYVSSCVQDLQHTLILKVLLCFGLDVKMCCVCGKTFLQPVAGQEETFTDGGGICTRLMSISGMLAFQNMSPEVRIYWSAINSWAIKHTGSDVFCVHSTAFSWNVKQAPLLLFLVNWSPNQSVQLLFEISGICCTSVHCTLQLLTSKIKWLNQEGSTIFFFFFVQFSQSNNLNLGKRAMFIWQGECITF